MSKCCQDNSARPLECVVVFQPDLHTQYTWDTPCLHLLFDHQDHLKYFTQKKQVAKATTQSD